MGYEEDLSARLIRGLIQGLDRAAFEPELRQLRFSAAKIRGNGSDAVVELTFGHEMFPGVTFGYRFPAYDAEGDPDEWSGDAWASVVMANLAEDVYRTRFEAMVANRANDPVIWISD